jgi:hypothetical protein
VNSREMLVGRLLDIPIVQPYATWS